MKMLRTLLAFCLLVLISCSTKRPVEATSSQLPVKIESEIPEERALSQWQEEKHKNFFDWPVDEARMTRGFLPNRRRPHLGIDLAAPKGTKILAAHDGVVIYAGHDFRGFGRMVLIEGSNGWASLYAHFSTINVKEGDQVHQGDTIGGMGRTGRATGVHLHFEIRKSKGPVDPLLYLPSVSRLARH
jgi:murein DD-endopeptidase MepM/ murein hydrolase activator NlpD